MQRRALRRTASESARLIVQVGDTSITTVGLVEAVAQVTAARLHQTLRQRWQGSLRSEKRHRVKGNVGVADGDLGLNLSLGILGHLFTPGNEPSRLRAPGVIGCGF